MIEADMQEFYHIDMSAPGLLTQRSGRWLRVRIRGLQSVKSRLNAAMFPPKEK